MVVCAVVGSLDLFTAIFADKWWIAAIGIFAAVCAYFAAWISYRNAQRYAKGIDEVYESINAQMRLHLHVLAMMIQAKSAPEAKTPETKGHEEHEDIGHPV